MPLETTPPGGVGGAAFTVYPASELPTGTQILLDATIIGCYPDRISPAATFLQAGGGFVVGAQLEVLSRRCGRDHAQ